MDWDPNFLRFVAMQVDMSLQVELCCEGLVTIVAVVNATGRVYRVPFSRFALLCQWGV